MNTRLSGGLVIMVSVKVSGVGLAADFFGLRGSGRPGVFCPIAAPARQETSTSDNARRIDVESIETLIRSMATTSGVHYNASRRRLVEFQLAEQPAHVCLGREFDQVIHLFADADVSDRDAKFLGYRHHYSAFRRSNKLGQAESRHRHLACE